jgi:hypothetical protein
MKKIILNLVFFLAAIFPDSFASAVTVAVSEKIPLNPESVRTALVEKDQRFAAYDAEILIYSYSTGKSVYRLNKKGDIEISDEPGEIEALIKFKGPQSSKKPLFIKGKGLDSASLSASLVEEALKALTPFLP